MIPDTDKLRLDDKVILITGSGDGIGKAVALACAERGATIILLGRTVHKLEQVYDEIKNNGCPEPAIYPMNLEGATPTDYEELNTNIDREFGRLDGLHNNAGWLGASTPIEIYDTELWYKVMQVNLNAPFLLTKACIPLLRKSTSARIVFTADDKSSAYWGAYGVAKAGQLSFMQILADELESKNIPVNAVVPGPTRTRFRTMAYPAEDARQLTKPEEITNAFIYLLSDAVSETGKTFRPGEG
ncbi:MAG: SDR family NAD(P)-dependent oxidoreductase [Gammaproteobacteria bacterium]|jgi:NAD(P)-dependent dehydrogenase (short-subunit alcohol dehydrogenase family)